jgi:hypothetical protein
LIFQFPDYQITQLPNLCFRCRAMTALSAVPLCSFVSSVVKGFAVGFANCYLLIAICLSPMMIYLQKSATNL